MDNDNENKTFIFIDGSYFCFYRYHSLLTWWKNAYPDEPLEDPYKNEKFVEKFKKTFIETIQKIPKNLKIDKNIKPILFVGKDCKREDIWRVELFKNYKANRKNGTEDGFMGGPFFKLVYEENLFKEGGVKEILFHNRLEADDSIAISVKYLLEKYENCSIYIITSDKDYLQLIEPRVKIFSLAFKNLAEQKSSFGNSQTDLFCKIVMGDISDNIPSVLKKCGPKTALKCFNDKEYFEKRLKDEDANEKYKLNTQLVDFSMIPNSFKEEFLENLYLKI